MTFSPRNNSVKKNLPGILIILLLLPLSAQIIPAQASFCCINENHCCCKKIDHSNGNGFYQETNNCKCNIHKHGSTEKLIYIGIKNIKHPASSFFTIITTEQYVTIQIFSNIIKGSTYHLKYLPLFLTNSSMRL